MDSRNILIAAEDIDDAKLVHDIIAPEFDNVTLSTDPAQAVVDFEEQRPAVLVLAFSSLEAAQAYYLGLYRVSTQIQSIVHRTVILCRKEELERVYLHCKRGHYANYVLFWPLGYDSTRLGMEIHHALSEVEQMESSQPTSAEFAEQANLVANLKEELENQLHKGEHQMQNMESSVEQAEQLINSAIDDVAVQIDEACSSTAHNNDYTSILQQLGKQIDELKQVHVHKNLQHTRETIQPIRQMAESIQQQVEEKAAPLQQLKNLAENFRPKVLVVDDDEFQHKLLKQMLSILKVDLVFASSSHEAFRLLHQLRPEMILMDVGLPDINGLETTRRIRSVKRFAEIPIIMITGNYGNKEIVMKSLKAGASDFVVKPINKKILVRKIRLQLNLESNQTS